MQKIAGHACTPLSLLVVMGVSGSGKTTVGRLLAESLGWKFFDADSFHSAAGIEKMSRGESLTDQDRLPWLRRLRSLLMDCARTDQHTVLACSALKKRYRRLLLPNELSNRVGWIYLKGTRELVESRMQQRKGHFFQPHLLASQFATLEEPQQALVLDIRKPTERLVQEAVEYFRLRRM